MFVCIIFIFTVSTASTSFPTLQISSLISFHLLFYLLVCFMLLSQQLSCVTSVSVSLVPAGITAPLPFHSITLNPCSNIASNLFSRQNHNCLATNLLTPRGETSGLLYNKNHNANRRVIPSQPASLPFLLLWFVKFSLLSFEMTVKISFWSVWHSVYS